MEKLEQRDALARVIDPMNWDLHDDERMAKQSDVIRDILVRPSRALADRIMESGLMASFEWDRREYQSARQRIMDRTSRTGKCYPVEDGLDGYFMHDPKCERWPEGAIGGSGCIK